MPTENGFLWKEPEIWFDLQLLGFWVFKCNSNWTSSHFKWGLPLYLNSVRFQPVTDDTCGSTVLWTLCLQYFYIRLLSLDFTVHTMEVAFPWKQKIIYRLNYNIYLINEHRISNNFGRIFLVLMNLLDVCRVHDESCIGELLCSI